jgi:hypothetical protein
MPIVKQIVIQYDVEDLEGQLVTPCIMLFPDHLHYKLNQASSVMVNQVVEFQNQNSK